MVKTYEEIFTEIRNGDPAVRHQWSLDFEIMRLEGAKDYFREVNPKRPQDRPMKDEGLAALSLLQVLMVALRGTFDANVKGDQQ